MAAVVMAVTRHCDNDRCVAIATKAIVERFLGFPPGKGGFLAVVAEGNMILCVDDEPKGLYLRKVILQRKGYEVLTATSGREALELFTANHVGAVILDYAMPEMDGGQVAAEMKRLRPEVKILLFSAYLDLPQDALKYIDARVVKGAAPTALLDAVQHLLPSVRSACNCTQ